VKRRELLNHLRAKGCRFVREGGGHTVVVNPATGRRSTVPRHREIAEFTAGRICRQLGMPKP
jgi:mRNA interferase HicA